MDHQYTKMFEDDDKEMDIDSDEEDRLASPVGGLNSTNKRAHHNALERKRRDHIKESFNSLRDVLPSLEGEKSSRAQILNKATECIQNALKRNSVHQQDIDNLERENKLLEQQIREIERSNRQYMNGQDYLSELESDDGSPPRSYNHAR